MLFIQVTFFYVFNVLKFFTHFLFKKNVVKCKVWICKNPTNNTLNECLSNDFHWLWFITSPILQNILLTCWH